MLIKRYLGKSYIIEIDSTPVAEGVVFTITAIDRVSRRCSDINNLNAIISAFDLEEDDPRGEESEWLLSNEERVDFQIAADSIFKSPGMLEQIESALDEDRMEGEWARIRE